MPKLAIMTASAAAMLACSGCAGEPDDRSVLFGKCEKEKTHSTAACQCIVDAQIEYFDKDVLRVLVLRAQGKDGEADALMQSIPTDRSADQTIKFAYAATACEKSGN